MSVSLPTLDAVFLHIPRAAGTWVKRALDAAGIETLPARGAATHNLPERYADPGFRFCFVRHPLAWLESLWRGHHGAWPLLPEQRDQPALFVERSFSPVRLISRRCGERGFDEFIHAVLVNEPALWTRTCEWYAGAPGVPKVQAVGRAERAHPHLTAILRRLGWSGELPLMSPENAGEHPRPEWSPELRDRLLASEAAGLQRWYPDWPHVPELPDFCEVTW